MPNIHSKHSQVYSFPLFDLLEMWLDGVAAPAAAAARLTAAATAGAQQQPPIGPVATAGSFQRQSSIANNNVLTEARLRSKVMITRELLIPLESHLGLYAFIIGICSLENEKEEADMISP